MVFNHPVCKMCFFLLKSPKPSLDATGDVESCHPGRLRDASTSAHHGQFHTEGLLSEHCSVPLLTGSSRDYTPVFPYGVASFGLKMSENVPCPAQPLFCPLSLAPLGREVMPGV